MFQFKNQVLFLFENSLYFIITLIISLLFPFSIWAQEAETQTTSSKHFDGIYVGSSVGLQNIFGGAFIDDLDVLAQKSGFVLELSTGYRKQFCKKRIMAGAEFSYGFTDGNMEEVDPRYHFMIFYENNNQLGVGLQAGAVLGKMHNILLYVFYNETKRKFDISFETPDGFTHTQEDTQYFARFGIGAELPLYKRFHIRANVAKSYTDYGDLETSTNVNDKIDVNLGVTVSF